MRVEGGVHIEPGGAGAYGSYCRVCAERDGGEGGEVDCHAGVGVGEAGGGGVAACFDGEGAIIVRGEGGEDRGEGGG